MLRRLSVLLLSFGSLSLLQAQTSGQPACQFNYQLTNRSTEQTDGITNILVSGGTARTPSINNRASNCNSWYMQFTIDGFSAASLELDDSQNIYTIQGGTPLSWAAWQGTVLSGSNPSTVTTSGSISFTGFYPWLSIFLGSSTGTGSVYVTLYGWKTPSLLGFFNLNGTTCFVGGTCTISTGSSVPGTSGQVPTANGSGGFGTSVSVTQSGAVSSLVKTDSSGDIIATGYIQSGSSPPTVTGTGVVGLGESTSQTCTAASVDCLIADSGTHRLLISNNNTSGGAVVGASTTDTFTNKTLTNILTASNCSSSASPAVCGSAAAGSVSIPTGTNSTLQVNTTAVTANSQIFVFPDDTLGTKLSVTCNSTLVSLIGGLAVTARTGGTSFTITLSGTTSTNPVCASFLIVN